MTEISSLAVTVATARDRLNKLRAAAENASPLAKVVGLIEDLESRLEKLESSAVEAVERQPLPFRKRG